MTFLQTSGIMPKVPVDPINNMTGDGTPSGTYAYRYYCYTANPYSGPHLGYWSEQTGGYVNKATNNASTWTDPSFPCK